MAFYTILIFVVLSAKCIQGYAEVEITGVLFDTTTTRWFDRSGRRQEEGEAAPEQPKEQSEGQAKVGNEGEANSGHELFIEFNRYSDSADRFVYESREYLITSMKLGYKSAKSTCALKYNGELAVLPDMKTLNFVAEALSETRLALDTVWISARKEVGENDWKWEPDSGETIPFDKDLYALMKVTDLKLENDNRECLGFGREDHDKPQLRPLECEARRGFICDRSRSGPGRGNSTHKGWIVLGDREYKILAQHVPYKRAAPLCNALGSDVQLAVVRDFNASEQLGRYLLIGRPSLENAWIGARWKDNEFYFEAEDVRLSNTTDENKYPPWRNGAISKPGGCLLLDRHLSSVTLFVEANCNRERAVICYRMKKNDETTDTIDIITDIYGYRVELSEKPWDKARQYCIENYSGKQGRLVEITEADILKHLIYIMSENRTALQHIWIGARYQYASELNELEPKSRWRWASNTESKVELIELVQNQTFTENVEMENNCLNMDRENHLIPLFYGTLCDFPQVFICQFPKEQLLLIQEEERKKREENS